LLILSPIHLVSLLVLSTVQPKTRLILSLIHLVSPLIRSSIHLLFPLVLAFQTTRLVALPPVLAPTYLVLLTIQPITHQVLPTIQPLTCLALPITRLVLVPPMSRTKARLDPMALTTDLVLPRLLALPFVHPPKRHLVSRSCDR